CLPQSGNHVWVLTRSDERIPWLRRAAARTRGGVQSVGATVVRLPFAYLQRAVDGNAIEPQRDRPVLVDESDSHPRPVRLGHAVALPALDDRPHGLHLSLLLFHGFLRSRGLSCRATGGQCDARAASSGAPSARKGRRQSGGRVSRDRSGPVLG